MRKSGVVMSCVIAWTASAPPASANPFDFLRRVGHSILHPHQKEVVRRPVRKGTARRVTADTEKGDEQDADEATRGSQPVPALSATPSETPAQTVPVQRAASRIPGSRVQRTDLPYGVPVPNRPGLVVSPYSPNGGFVDTRDIPSGTAVKDPYTGKIFLTP